MKSKIISLVLCFAMVLSITTGTAFAMRERDGSIEISATKTTVNVGETVDVVFSVNATTEPVGSVNFTVDISDGLEYVSHTILVSTSDFLMSAYTPETGVFGCGVTTNGKTGKFDVLKITLKAKETDLGENTVAVEVGNMTLVDGETLLNFGTVEDFAIKTQLAPNAAKSIALNKTAMELTSGSSEQLEATLTGKNAGIPCTDTVNWTSSNEAVATVDEDGNVTAIAVGTAKITATASSSSKIKATCTVTVVCPHTNTTDHEAVPSTCKTQGVGAYTTCNACGAVTAGSDAKLPLDPNNHEGGTYEAGYEAPSCKEDGKQNSVYCEGCDALLTAGAVIPATGDHVDKDGKWSTDGINHWYVCKCGTKFAEEAHKGGTATCVAKAICEVCEKAYGDKNPENHTGETYEKGYEAPSCNEDGKQNSVYCKGCDVLLTAGAVIPSTGEHVDKDGKLEYNENGHWKTCKCGTTFDTADHELTETAEKDYLKSKATCVSPAVYYKHCAFCKFVSEDTFVVGEPDLTAHKWKLVEVTVEPTVDAEGEALYECTVEGCDAEETRVLPKRNSVSNITPSNPEGEEPAEPVLPFTDVKKSDWFYNDVAFAYANGLMNGTGNNKFSPAVTTDRAMIVTVLWRMEGSPVVDSTVKFIDVETGAWYAAAIDWASANGIVNGYGDGKFGPTAQITREQIMAILNRYAVYKGWAEDIAVSMVAQYTCSIWAENNVNWADLSGLLADLGVDVTDMTAMASRAELAAYLSRFMENIAK